MVLKRTYNCLTAVVLKMTDCWLGSGSTAAAVWWRLTAEEAEAGLVAANIPVVWRWCLEERRLVLVKTAVVCQSVGSSSQTEDFRRNLKVLKDQSVGCQRLGRKSAALWIAAAVLCLPLGSAERVG